MVRRNGLMWPAKMNVHPRYPMFVLARGFRRKWLCEHEIDFFQLFFSNDLLEEICSETNRYVNARIQSKSPLTPRSPWNDWKDVTLEEMKPFLGILINMSLNPKPAIKDFFSRDWVTMHPFFSEVTTRDRFFFFQIFNGLHGCPPSAPGATALQTRSQK